MMGSPCFVRYTLPAGRTARYELTVVERRFGPIPEEEFHPDRFLDGPQIKAQLVDADADEPSLLTRQYGLPLTIGAVCLIGGTANVMAGFFQAARSDK